MGPSLDEVVRPHMVLPTRPEPDARAVIEPQPAPLGLLAGNLQPLAPPDAFHALVVDVPAFSPKERRDPTIAIAAVLAR